MTEQKTTTAINAALIIIGSYHLPATVAFGAIVGASLFILSQQSYSTLSKAWLFAVSFLSGVFGGDGAAGIINWLLPKAVPLHINEFTGAALFSALVVVAVQRLIMLVAHGHITSTAPAPHHTPDTETETEGKSHE